MKKQHIISAFLVTLMMFSVAGQGQKESFRVEKNYGFGVTPLINLSSTGQGSNRTTATNIGAIATATLNFRPKLIGTFGMGFLSDSYKYSFGFTDYKVSRNTVIVDLGLFTPLFFVDLGNGQLDLEIGLHGIGQFGNETITNDVGPDFEGDISSLVFAPSLRGEWFLNKTISLHSQVGVGLKFLTEKNNGFESSEISVKLFNSTELLGQAGFTFWF
ncbi:MAG: hypothetical protein AB8B72_00215 [Crocinitomicaceae bacterium]